MAPVASAMIPARKPPAITSMTSSTGEDSRRFCSRRDITTLAAFSSSAVRALRPHAPLIRRWRTRLCHQVHVEDFKPEAYDPLDQPGEGSQVGQLGAQGGRLRARDDLAVVELRAQR